MMKRGRFISFEGTEGTGKSTLIAGLKKALLKQGYKVTVTREPGGTLVSEAIRTILLSKQMDPWTELLLYEASRAEHVQTVILPALKAKHFVLCDRYADSSLAYQGSARGLNWKQIRRLNEIATQNLKPDLTLWLDLDPALGLKRATVLTKFEREGLGFQKLVRKGFQRIAREEPKRFVRIQAHQEREKLITHVLGLLQKKGWIR